MVVKWFIVEPGHLQTVIKNATHQSMITYDGLRGQKRKGLVFHTASGLPLDYHNIVLSLERYYNRIGVEPKKFHAYRATFITNLCRNGVLIQTVSKLAGHSNIKVTARYSAAISLDELTDAIGNI